MLSPVTNGHRSLEQWFAETDAERLPVSCDGVRVRKSETVILACCRRADLRYLCQKSCVAKDLQPAI